MSMDVRTMKHAARLAEWSEKVQACGHALVGCFRPRNLSRRRLLISLALFPIAPAVAGFLQFIYPALPVACVALAGATLVMYQNWLDDMISIDPLTRLNNRKLLAHYYSQWQRREEGTIYLLMIDANKFKAINDTYGHIQGDAALERIADALRLSCQGLPHRANIARYGGDEFVVLLRAEDEEEVETVREVIHKNLRSLSAGLPFDLTVSVGVCKARKDMSLKDLIAEADVRLYEEKRR